MEREMNIEECLSNHGIRRTSFRIELLEVFSSYKFGLTYKDIQCKLKSDPDKATIYRALDTFLEKGLIHKVPDLHNISKYALTEHHCEKKGHNHAHFICVKCENTFCMNELELPALTGVEGFDVKRTKLILEGVCHRCAKH